MILLATIPEACLSYLALGGIFALGGALGYAICTILDRDPSAELHDNLITNKKALELINNYRTLASPDNTVSGHLKLGVLLGYIKKVQSQCKTIGKELSGLEYYFAKYDGVINNDPTNVDDNSGRSTIVLYPTYEDDSNHIPFDPFAPMSGGAPVTVQALNSVSSTARTGAEYDSKWVLDKSNMSPPRQNTI